MRGRSCSVFLTPVSRFFCVCEKHEKKHRKIDHNNLEVTMSKSKKCLCRFSGKNAEKLIHVSCMLPEPLPELLKQYMSKSRIPLGLIIRKALIALLAREAR